MLDRNNSILATAKGGTMTSLYIRHIRLLLITVLVCACACSDDDGPAADGPSRLDVDTKVVDAKVVDTQIADSPQSDHGAWSCPTYQAATKAGTVTNTAINETSGLEVSSVNTGVLWLHNDSGDSPRTFAISSKGELLGEYTLSGAAAVDWEDMALGPGEKVGKPYLYLGDIGDNPSSRSNIMVYRVAEPTVSATQSPVKETLSGVETLTFEYPDGAHNAETLLVDPKTGDLYIVAKTGALPAGIYRSAAPQAPGTTRTLTKIGEVSLGVNITGGDISDDGTEVLLRTYTAAYLWHWPSGASLAEALSGTKCMVPAATEPQGEAISFEPKTKNYYTLSEKTSQPLYLYTRN